MSDKYGLPSDAESWTIKDFKKSRRILRRLERKAQKISNEILNMIGIDRLFEIEKLKKELVESLASERTIGQMLFDVAVEIENRLREAER